MSTAFNFEQCQGHFQHVYSTSGKIDQTYEQFYVKLTCLLSYLCRRYYPLIPVDCFEYFGLVEWGSLLFIKKYLRISYPWQFMKVIIVVLCLTLLFLLHKFLLEFSCHCFLFLNLFFVFHHEWTFRNFAFFQITNSA